MKAASYERTGIDKFPGGHPLFKALMHKVAYSVRRLYQPCRRLLLDIRFPAHDFYFKRFYGPSQIDRYKTLPVLGFSSFSTLW